MLRMISEDDMRWRIVHIATTGSDSESWAWGHEENKINRNNTIAEYWNMRVPMYRQQTKLEKNEGRPQKMTVAVKQDRFKSD